MEKSEGKGGVKKEEGGGEQTGREAERWREAGRWEGGGGREMER